MSIAFLIAIIFASLSLILSIVLIKCLHKINKQKEELNKQNFLIQNNTEDLRIASNYRTAFLKNMSHQMRTPLNVIIGLTDLMLDEKGINKKIFDSLTNISSAGAALLSIINDILDFTKIETGKLTLMSAEYYLASLLNDITTLVNTRLKDNNVTFVLDIEEDLPTMLYGDDLRVKQIINNLLNNAVKFTEAGEIKLSIKCSKKQENNNDIWLEIKISDTGIGINEEGLDTILNEYFEAEMNGNKTTEVKGLNLSITKQLVEMMEGTIHVENIEDSGSIFSVKIKQTYVNDSVMGPQIVKNLKSFRYNEEKKNLFKNLKRPDLSYARVLVADDMQTNLDVALGLLGKYKLKIDTVLNGQDAIKKIEQGKPIYNAIFMDHMMPGMTGIEAADAIRALDSEYARKIPIIALTANAVKGTEDLFYAHDFQAFLSKPIDILGLDEIIRKWIGNERIEETKTGLNIIDKTKNSIYGITKWMEKN